MYDKQMIRYSESDIPPYLPEQEKELIRKANDMRWEDIEPKEAMTEEGRRILNDIASSKYHLDEFKSGMD